MSKKKIDPLALLNIALSPLDKLNFHLMQLNLSKQSPRHVIVSQLWMLQNRLEGEWDRLMLHQAPTIKKLKNLRGVREKQAALPAPTAEHSLHTPATNISKTG